jgi:hypothetical protein
MNIDFASDTTCLMSTNIKARTIARATSLSAALALALLAPAALAQALPAAGTTSSGTYTLPNSVTTAGEHPWVIRILSYHPSAVVPRRMYNASCTVGGVRKFFATATIKYPAGSEGGMIMSGDVNTTTGAVSNFTSQQLACKEMGGVVASSDCSTVTAMCRRPATATGATRDLVAALPNTATGNDWRDWLTSEAVDDQMWLYEWKGAPATPTSSTSTYSSYVVSKAIGGGWEYGHQNLVMSGTHYGVAMKSTTGKDAAGTQHQGDSFVAVTRASVPANTAIDTTRGWKWACASGHTLANRPVLSTTGKFGAFCTTDWNNVANNYTKGGIYMRVEGLSAALTTSIFKSTSSALRFNGGNTSILPTANGEFIGVLVGSANPSIAERSRIGLARFNSSGALLSSVWVQSSATHFLSYPQLVSLGNDASGTPRYLLGWAQMMASNATSTFDNPSPDQTQRLATKYFVQEIDANGTAKAAVKELVHGWGEQDQMVSLGAKRAGWVYRPDGRVTLSADGTTVTNLPSPNSTQLIWMTYTSTSM